jgi:hypothetical protein
VTGVKDPLADRQRNAAKRPLLRTGRWAPLLDLGKRMDLEMNASMTSNKSRSGGTGLALAAALALLSAAPLTTAATCDPIALAEAKAVFEEMVGLRSTEPALVEELAFRAAARTYIDEVEACSSDTAGEGLSASGLNGGFVDDGGVWFDSSGGAVSANFVTWGTKWGDGSPFTGGQDVGGPRIPGGTVTYSYMGNGISLAAEGAGTTTAITSLPTYNSCILAEITLAFAAWSAVSNIQFVQVADSGVAFNSYTASGDIRLAAHTFDGAYGTLAHGYYPPPNGWSAAGDIHFDVDENWSCTGGGGFDIGIVATHEIGHAIGLGHEPTTGNLAVMQPYYNASLTSLQPDDIQGATSIYNGSAQSRFTSSARSDIVWHNSDDGRNAVWFMDGLARSGSANLFSVSDTNWSIAGVGDFDSNGFADLLWRNSSDGRNAVWLMDGTQRIASANLLSVPISWDVVGISDFDGDGRADILWRNSADGRNSIWFMDGTQRTSAANLLSVSDPQWHVMGAGDMDGDGKADIVWRNLASGADAVWFMDGGTRIAAGNLLSVADLGWSVAAVADFDRDGRCDLLWRNSSDGRNAMWIMNGAARTQAGNLLTVDSAWGVSATDDYNGDGHADIFWRNQSTGANAVWLMTGVQRTGAGNLEQVSDLNWGPLGSG